MKSGDRLQPIMFDNLAYISIYIRQTRAQHQPNSVLFLPTFSLIHPMSENPKPPRVFLYAKFDISALTQLAETLRHVPCRCNQNQSPRCGALNWAIFLIFENGVEWVFRSPRKPYYITPETTAELLQSEVATMKYIKQHSSVPVPDILDYWYDLSKLQST